MKGKIRIIAKFHRTDLVICSHSRERKPPSYSRRNTVHYDPLRFTRGLFSKNTKNVNINFYSINVPRL